MLRFSTIALAISILFAASVYMYAPSVPFKDQWPLFDALRTTASIIIAAMGAWLAILYPEISKKTSIKEFSATEDDIESIKKLSLPIVYATVIVIAISLLGSLSSLIKTISILIKYRDISLRISYASLNFLTAWLVCILFSTLVGPLIAVASLSDRSKASILIRKKFNITKND